MQGEKVLGKEFLKNREIVGATSPSLTPIHGVTLSESLPMPESPLPPAGGAVGGDALRHFLLSKSTHLLWGRGGGTTTTPMMLPLVPGCLRLPMVMGGHASAESHRFEGKCTLSIPIQFLSQKRRKEVPIRTQRRGHKAAARALPTQRPPSPTSHPPTSEGFLALPWTMATTTLITGFKHRSSCRSLMPLKFPASRAGAGQGRNDLLWEPPWSGH